MNASLFEFTFIENAFLAAIFAGVACSIIGVFIVLKRLSALGICLAHVAFAGALFGVWMGLNQLLCAFVFSILAIFILAPLSQKQNLNPDTATGIVFSTSLGLAFLFIGLIPGSKSEALSLFWGSILMLSSFELICLGLVCGIVVVLHLMFFKEIQAFICHENVARNVGMPVGFLFCTLLLLSGLTITTALPSVGGLLIYSLIVNPAAAAHQLTLNYKKLYLLAIIFGVASCMFGLMGACLFDLPCGALIVLSSTLIFAIASVFKGRFVAGS